MTLTKVEPTLNIYYTVPGTLFLNIIIGTLHGTRSPWELHLPQTLFMPIGTFIAVSFARFNSQNQQGIQPETNWEMHSDKKIP